MTRGTFGAEYVAAEFPSSLAGTGPSNARGGAALPSGPPTSPQWTGRVGEQCTGGGPAPVGTGSRKPVLDFLER